MATEYSPKFTEELLKSLVYSDGSLLWTHRPIDHFVDERAWKIWNTKNAGLVAGSTNKKGYIYIAFSIGDERRLVRRNRIVWIMFNGHWPENQVDHRDGVRTNDRIENLREVGGHVNQQNRKGANANNELQILGVGPARAEGRFSASVQFEGKKLHLGTFDSAYEAEVIAFTSRVILYEGANLDSSTSKPGAV
jgi:hypothetical protein